ncbi:MAG: PCYCGC motif-containing (lipo)protein [Anaerolineae bacterium]
MPSKNPKRQTKPHRRKRGTNPLYVLIPVALVMLTGGVWLLMTSPASSGTSEPPMFPAWLQVMDPQVRQAYAQAVAHREELAYIPCFCGCGGMGHAAVVDCHIANVAADGSITYEQHAST